MQILFNKSLLSENLIHCFQCEFWSRLFKVDCFCGFLVLPQWGEAKSNLCILEFVHFL